MGEWAHWFAATIGLCAGTAVSAAQPPPICADRPGKANATCTAPAGHFQLEMGLADWTLDHNGGERRTLLVLGATAIKYGLTDRSHIELDVIPWEQTKSRTGTVHDSASGFGDVLARYKEQLTAPGAAVQVTVYPFVKIPTAKRALGNGRVEAGVEFPINLNVGDSAVSLAFDPEVDAIADSDGHGYHPAMGQAFDVNAALGSSLIVTGELWGRWDYDPSGTGKQVSVDGSVAYLITNSVQIDGGANFGLNRQTPDVELYAGVSKRF